MLWDYLIGRFDLEKLVKVFLRKWLNWFLKKEKELIRRRGWVGKWGSSLGGESSLCKVRVLGWREVGVSDGVIGLGVYCIGVFYLGWFKVFKGKVFGSLRN